MSFFFSKFTYECFASMYVYINHAFLVLWRSERGGWLDLLELELRIVVSHHVAAGNRTMVLCKSTFLAAEPSL